MEDRKNNLSDRRKFMITIGNSAIGVISAGSIGLVYDFMRPNVVTELPSRFQIGTPENYQPDSFVFNEEYQLFIVRNEEGSFYAISSICTHLGCTVNKRPVNIPEQPEKVIFCPCHGSIYSVTGNVISGPAPRPLDRFRIRMQDGKLIIDKNEIVSENDMFLKVR